MQTIGSIGATRVYIGVGLYEECFAAFYPSEDSP